MSVEQMTKASFRVELKTCITVRLIIKNTFKSCRSYLTTLNEWFLLPHQIECLLLLLLLLHSPAISQGFTILGEISAYVTVF